MGFQRAQWHSGLTYQQTCPTCKTVLQYTDYSLDFRPWYADGYVDCPKCKSHLRHNENYALGRDGRPKDVTPAPAPAPAPAAPAAKPLFCTACGNRYGENDLFCAQCGKKRG